MKPPPDNWEYTLSTEERAHKWKYAAGETPGKTEKQAKTAHRNARKWVWYREKARLAGLKDEKDRTEKEKDDLFRVKDRAAHQKSHVGNSCVAPMLPPPARWKPWLVGKPREKAWKYAAGTNEDGSSKTPDAHASARRVILRDDRVYVAQAKDESERTDEDHAIMKEDDDRKAKDMAQRRARRDRVEVARDKPEIERTEDDLAVIKADDDRREYLAAYHAAQRDRVNVARAKDEIERTDKDRSIIKDDDDRKAYNAARNARTAKMKMDICIAFNEFHGLEALDGEVSEEDVCDMVYTIMHDKSSAKGKALFDALDGKTLFEAFYGGKSDYAINVLSSRGHGGVGGSNAESHRSLTRNKNARTTVLTDMNGKNFNFSDQAFKDLGAEYFPIGPDFKSYAYCSAFESVVQFILNFLLVGSSRLWLQANVGRYHRPFRTCDMKIIEELKKQGKDKEAKNVVFCVGILLIKNVSILSRKTDDVGKDIVTSIKAGLGTTCMVHQPKRLPWYSSKEQQDAIEKLRERLGLNYVDMCRKRKAEVLEDQYPTHEDGNGFELCESDEFDNDSDDE
jgi:hypothetical protein